MLKKTRSRIRYRNAIRRKQPDEVLCATVGEDGGPIYFTMPADATDAQVREEAFRLRYGRPMNPLERILLEIAEDRRGAA